MPRLPLLLILLGAAASILIWQSLRPRQTLPVVSTQPATSPDDRVAAARLRCGKHLVRLCKAAGLSYPPGELFLRGFKAERQLEAWARDDTTAPYRLVASWPVLAASGGPGPKRREGDRQVPEGCYRVVAWNPKSSFHLSLGLDYPNASDRVRSDPEKPGFDIYLHGGAASIGCLAIGDARAEELYLLAADVRSREIPVHLFPARMQGPAWQTLRTAHPEHTLFWSELQPIHDAFENTHRVPNVAIDKDGEYSLVAANATSIVDPRASLDGKLLPDQVMPTQTREGVETYVDFLITGPPFEANDFATSARVSDVEIYRRIWEIAKDHFRITAYDPGHKDSAISIKCLPNHPALPGILALLKEARWTPYYGRQVPKELRKERFQVRMVRHYADEEIDRSPLLYIDGFGDDIVADYAGRKADRWIGKVEGARWDRRVGRIYGELNYFVSDATKQSLEAAGLQGLRFLPLEWDEPGKAEGKFWELDSTYTMPPCLLPTIQLITNTRPDGNHEYSTSYDEGCYFPVELPFLRSEVEKMGSFDVAWTREDLLWTKPNAGRHRLIVSQRFRRMLNELGIQDVTYRIVRLVDEPEKQSR